MTIFNTINNLKQWQVPDDEMVKNLYLYSEKSLRAVILVSLFISVVLSNTTLGNIVYLWGAVVIIFSVYRLLHAHQFKNELKQYSLQKWYQIFVIDAIVLIILINLLALVILPQVNQLYQLFIMVVFLGLSGGALHSLSPDYKLSLLYQVLVLVPVIIMSVLQGYELNLYAAVVVSAYFITQLNIIKEVHTQGKILLKKEEEINNAQELLREKQNMLEYFFEEAPIGIMSYDMDLVIIDCNTEAVNLFKSSREKLIGLDLHHLKDKRPLSAIKRSLTDGSQVYKGHYESLTNLSLWIEIKCFPVIDRKDHVVGGIIVIENKTEEYKAYQKLEYQAYHDILTTLSNRRGFLNFIEEMIHKEKHRTYFSLLFFVDLNRFKHINDSLGHSVGDKLLIEVSKRLKESIDAYSNLSRLGGDEFLIVIPFTSEDKVTAIENAKEYVLEIQTLFKEVFIIDDIHLYMSVSIGIVCIEPGFGDVDEIVRQADMSMYEAKELGHNQHVSFYNIALDEERKKVFSLQQDILYGLKNDQFRLYYQPIVNIKDDTVHAAEALIRWEHPTKGFIEPEGFIPLAINSGTIIDIDWWVIDTACKQIAKWKKDHKWNIHYLAVNVNAQELLREDFVSHFLEKLAQYNIVKNDIKIEITETCLIDNFDDAEEVIKTLHSHGVSCVIDDFGTGYSSLSYLKRLSFHTLKIDRTFIRDIEDREEDILLMTNIISIGKQYNYDIVVEGVEEEKQRNTILAIDDDVFYQGFLFSPAVKAEEFENKFLKN